MTIYYQDDLATLYHGDCLDVLASMPDNSIDSIVTDPPYGLSNTTPEQVAETITRWVSGDREYLPTGRGFMGKEWDSFVPPVAVWDECLRVLKPGGHVVAFAGSRTHDFMTLSIRLAGFEIRDSLAWLYGSGFPKSQNISLQIEKQAGKRGHTAKGFLTAGDYGGRGLVSPDTKVQHSPLTMDEAKQWDGWGTALKPAFEPIVLARKPFPGTVARNVLEHGTGAINVDGCRVGTTDNLGRPQGTMPQPMDWGNRSTDGPFVTEGHAAGRFPANVLLDEHAAAWVDEQSGTTRSSVGVNPPLGKSGGIMGKSAPRADAGKPMGHNDVGGASRFFYTAKAPKSERPNVDGVQHPTVKPLAIMQWLIRLITPPGGTVLDPFAGSGTTIEAAMMEGFHPVGIERETDYLPLITARITRAKTPAQGVLDLGGIA